MVSSEKQEIKERVRAAVDIVALISEGGVELKRSGRYFRGLCPFHAEETPSFSVSKDGQFFKCFGCGVAGDVFSFVMARERCEFSEALRMLAAKAGVEMEMERDAISRAKLRREIESTLEAYTDCAGNSWAPEAWARAVAIKPWLTEEIRTAWRLGYAPDLERLRAAGLDEGRLREAGLLRDGQRGAYLHFRDSLIIPFVERGRIVYLSDRALGPRAPNKLSLPNPDEDGRGGVTAPAGFNLDALREDGDFLLVEGPLDAIACSARGHTAVAMLSSRPKPGLVERIWALT